MFVIQSRFWALRYEPVVHVYIIIFMDNTLCPRSFYMPGLRSCDKTAACLHSQTIYVTVTLEK